MGISRRPHLRAHNRIEHPHRDLKPRTVGVIQPPTSVRAATTSNLADDGHFLAEERVPPITNPTNSRPVLSVTGTCTTRTGVTPLSDTVHPSTSKTAIPKLLDPLNTHCPPNRGNSNLLLGTGGGGDRWDDCSAGGRRGRRCAPCGRGFVGLSALLHKWQVGRPEVAVERSRTTWRSWDEPRDRHGGSIVSGLEGGRGDSPPGRDGNVGDRAAKGDGSGRSLVSGLLGDCRAWRVCVVRILEGSAADRRDLHWPDCSATTFRGAERGC